MVRPFRELRCLCSVVWQGYEVFGFACTAGVFFLCSLSVRSSVYSCTCSFVHQQYVMNILNTTSAGGIGCAANELDEGENGSLYFL